MSVFQPHSVKCGCGASFVADLADGVNIDRLPEARAQIISGAFHRFNCPTCQRRMTIEKEFSYIDLARNTFIKVKPRHDRHLWKEASAALEEDLQRVPSVLSDVRGRTERVVFGLGELREKLIAEDHGIDDRMVEMLKALLIYEHPFLIQTSRVRILLDGVRVDQVDFISCYDHDQRTYRIGMPRAIVDNVLERRTDIEKWVGRDHKKSNLFHLDRDYWVNFWRWSPQTWALGDLYEFAREVRFGRTIQTRSRRFTNMVKYLPRGSHLPGWAKRDLRAIYLYAKQKKLAALEDSLFEIRFGIGLDDDWAYNDDPNDIDTLWKLLRDLPDTNVEGNTSINEIHLAEGQGGGWYEPWSHDIHIGGNVAGNAERFQDVIRHEVGHAVHDRFDDRVTPWLESRFGWRTFGTSSADIDRWVDLMGGWGNARAAERIEIRSFLGEALGPGSRWTPGPAPDPPSGHAWWREGFGPRLAYEGTRSNWYNSSQNWHRVNGKAFFMNFWYRKLMVVDEATLDLISTKMPSRYAAMSPLEFFAELYALYYDLDDPGRPSVPPDAMEWMDRNIGSSDPESGGEPGLGPAHRSGGTRIARPGAPPPSKGSKKTKAAGRNEKAPAATKPSKRGAR
jgi:hypothetical protein